MNNGILCPAADVDDHSTEETSMMSQAAMLTAKLGSTRLQGICTLMESLLGCMVQAQNDPSGRQTTHNHMVHKVTNSHVSCCLCTCGLIQHILAYFVAGLV